MKVYVAAKFNDKERVKNLYVLLKQAGHTITHEWVHNREAAPFSAHAEFTAQCAEQDIDGVRMADIFIVLSNAEPSMGSAAELGAAISSFLIFKRPHIYVVGPHFDTNFCYYHPVVIRSASVEQVLFEMGSLGVERQLECEL